MNAQQTGAPKITKETKNKIRVAVVWKEYHSIDRG